MDPDKYIIDVFDILNIPPINTVDFSPVYPAGQFGSGKQANVLRYLNKFTTSVHYKPKLPLFKIGTKTRGYLKQIIHKSCSTQNLDVRKMIPQNIKEHFVKSHQNLSLLLNRDISTLGYDTSIR
jgi:hypothetical protein